MRCDTAQQRGVGSCDIATARTTRLSARGMSSISRYIFCIAKGGAAFVLRHGSSAHHKVLLHGARAQRHSTTGAATQRATRPSALCDTELCARPGRSVHAA